MPKKRPAKARTKGAVPARTDRRGRRQGEDRRQFPPRPEGRRTGGGRRAVDPPEA